jgi:hypothetical protein
MLTHCSQILSDILLVIPDTISRKSMKGHLCFPGIIFTFLQGRALELHPHL